MTTPGAAGTADLKAYDVPDPPRPAGWKLRCVVASLVALALAAGLVRLLRLPHLFWVVEHHPERYGSETQLPWIGGTVLGWLEEEYDADALRPYALEVDDLRLRGRLHQVLVGSGDPAQLDAMFAYMRCAYSDGERASRRWSASGSCRARSSPTS